MLCKKLLSYLLSCSKIQQKTLWLCHIVSHSLLTYIHFILATALITEPPAGPDSKTTESPLAAYCTDMPCPSTITQHPQRPTAQLQRSILPSTFSSKPKKKNRCSYCNRKVKLTGM